MERSDVYGVSSKDEGESPPNFGVSVQFNLPNSLGEYLVKVVILYVIMYSPAPVEIKTEPAVRIEEK